MCIRDRYQDGLRGYLSEALAGAELMVPFFEGEQYAGADHETFAEGEGAQWVVEMCIRDRTRRGRWQTGRAWTWRSGEDEWTRFRYKWGRYRKTILLPTDPCLFQKKCSAACSGRC